MVEVGGKSVKNAGGVLSKDKSGVIEERMVCNVR